MCNIACIDFGLSSLSKDDITGKRVIEVGAMDVNGSLRPHVASFGPQEYIGVDIAEGPGVDEICSVYELADRFGPESFDVVVSNEMLEHVQDWRSAVSQMKAITRPGGILLITTRSFGFPYHGYPFDFWRYKVDDMKAIFSDMTIDAIESDTIDPGVFLRTRKPASFTENDLRGYALYSMVSRRRSTEIEFSRTDRFLLALRTNVVARKLKGATRRLLALPERRRP